MPTAPRKLTPETKTVRFMTNALGLVAAKTSTRIKKRSFDLYGFVDVQGFAPILGGTTGGACSHFQPMDALAEVCRNCRCRMAEHVGDPREVASFLMVQATSSSNQAARRKKILDSHVLRLRAFALISSGHPVEVWGWISGRHAGAQAVRRFELCGSSPAGLKWNDKGVTEVPPELLEPHDS